MRSTLYRTLRLSPWPSQRSCASSLNRSTPLHFPRQYSSTEESPDSAPIAVQEPSKPPADHRKIATEQELFINDVHSPGSPIFLPNGAYIFNKLIDLIKAQYPQFGFQEVITPTIYKKSLWEKSGHWENYAEDMYAVKGRGATGEGEGRELGENEEYGLKPMNCPGHCLIFGSKLRSYRDLPIRYADHSALHRNEISGALSGLTRVRRFHQDDGHIFCRPIQIGEEIADTLKFIKIIYGALKLGPYRLALSTRPKENYIGTEEQWDNAEAALKQALEASKEEWTLQEGEGAFYGPKIDIILKDSEGKEHQTATIQLDFQLPQRFGLKYQAPAPELEEKGETTTDKELLDKQGPVTPVMIHRAVLGSVERMMALLIEHHNGRWPFWLNPRPVTIITSSDQRHIVSYARTVRYVLTYTRSKRSTLLHPMPYTLIGPVHIDDSARPVSKKILEAKKKQTGIIIVIGQQEVDLQCLSVDLRQISDPNGSIISGKFGRAGFAAKTVLDWCKENDISTQVTRSLIHSKGSQTTAFKDEDEAIFAKAREFYKTAENRKTQEGDKGRLVLRIQQLQHFLMDLYQKYQ